MGAQVKYGVRSPKFTLATCTQLCPNLQTQFSRKQAQNVRFQCIQNESFGLVFEKTGSNKFGHCTHWLRPRNTPPPASGLVYEGAIGQPKQTTSLCDPLDRRLLRLWGTAPKILYLSPYPVPPPPPICNDHVKAPDLVPVTLVLNQRGVMAGLEY